MVVNGNFDGISSNVIHGWAYDMHAPESLVTVEVFINDEKAGETIAQNSRSDLKAVGVRDGACAFAYIIDEHFLTKDVIDIHIKAKGDDLGKIIGLAQRFKRDEHGNFIFDSMINTSYEGEVISFDGVTLKGWAYNKTIGVFAAVNIYIDDILIDQIWGGEDFSPCPYQNAGFTYNIPYLLRDDAIHKIELKFHGTDFGLGGAPLNEKIHKVFLGDNPDDPVCTLVGHNNWLFLANDNNGSVQQHSGHLRLSNENLEQYQRLFEARGEKMKELGVPYILAICPSKESIYPEYLPNNFQKSPNGSMFDQLIGYMRAHSTFEILDLRPTMLAAKSQVEMPLYRRNDTHWNELGAYFGYMVIMQQVKKYFPNIMPIALDNFTIQQRKIYVGDLIERRQMELCADGSFQSSGKELPLEAEIMPSLNAKNARMMITLPTPAHIKPKQHRPGFLYETTDMSLPKMLFFGTSSSEYFRHWLPTHFSRSAFVWEHHLNHRIVEQEKPDLVINLLAERYIAKVPPE